MRGRVCLGFGLGLWGAKAWLREFFGVEVSDAGD